MESSGTFSQNPSSNAFLDKRMIILLIGAGLLVLLFLFLAFFTFLSKPKQQALTPTPPQPSTRPIAEAYQIQSGVTKLNDTKYAEFAHKVYPGPINTSDQELLKPFTFLASRNSDNTTKLTVIYPEKGIEPIEVNLLAGEQAYFIMPIPKEDMGDNFVIITDKNGSIIEQ